MDSGSLRTAAPGSFLGSRSACRFHRFCTVLVLRFWFMPLLPAHLPPAVLSFSHLIPLPALVRFTWFCTLPHYLLDLLRTVCWFTAVLFHCHTVHNHMRTTFPPHHRMPPRCLRLDLSRTTCLPRRTRPYCTVLVLLCIRHLLLPHAPAVLVLPVY